MDLPLVLRARSATLLVYSIPAWYRAVMGGVLGLILAALLVDGQAPSLIGWIFIALGLFGFLYEERWDFDGSAAVLIHHYGLIVARRAVRVAFGEIASFRLVPWVKGTLPGSADERAENARALAASRGQSQEEGEGFRRRPIFKRPYLALVCEHEGGTLLINLLPARRGDRLREIGARIAEFCQKPFEEG